LFSQTSRTFFAAVAFLLLAIWPAVGQDLRNDPAAKLLPDRLGDFRAHGSVARIESPDQDKNSLLSLSAATRQYFSKDDQAFRILVKTAFSESETYAEFSESRRRETSGIPGVVNDTGVGTASFSYSDGKRNHLCFFKDRVNACLEDYGGEPRNIRLLTDLAQALAATLDKGSGEIPVLVKHVPDWQNAQAHVLYAVDKETLKNAFANQPLLEEVSFDGRAEAVIADYGEQKLVVVEFNTASFATDNDQRIKAKLQELRSQGQSVPTAYRRVGNYAVFVFDAPNEQAANQLIDQVKYQQVVQWLGEDPFSYEKATREFTETTLGVFVSVVKASGIALVSCLAVGGFFGALLFSIRRSQQRAKEAFADSDAMLRLNLDDLTPESNPGRLLGREQ
jgi:hypothetical protein